MEKRNRRLAFCLTILMVSAIAMAFAPLALALPTADNFGVADNSGYQGTYVLVPVSITNAQDGPITAIIFNILYNNSRINVVDVQRGDLTPTWDNPSYNNFDRGTRVSIVYDTVDEHAIQNGSTGSVVVFNFNVIGEIGETSRMNFTDIQLSDTGYNVGTAPAKNGIFSIFTEPGPTPTPTEPPAGGGGGGGGGGTIPPTEVVVPTPTPTPTPTPSPSPTQSVTLTSTSTPTPSVALPVTSTPTPSVAPLPTPGPSPTPTQIPPLKTSDFGGIVFFITAYCFIFDSVGVTYLALKRSYRKLLRRAAGR